MSVHTNSTAVVIRTPAGILCIQRRFNDPMSWSLPGGKSKSDEDPKACARRQLVELLGFQVRHRHLELISTLFRRWQGGSASTALFGLRLQANRIPARFNSPYQHMLDIEWVPPPLLPGKYPFISHHRAVLEKAGLWPKKVRQAA